MSELAVEREIDRSKMQVSDEVAIENAVREMGRMEEAKRRYLEGKG